LQTALLIICICATLALVVAAGLFAPYYSKNKNRLFIADIEYQRHPALRDRALSIDSFAEAETLRAGFVWGGCRTENHDQIKGTFRLHCWGLARNPETLARGIKLLKSNKFDVNATPSGRAALRVTAWRKEELDGFKRFTVLLAAFCHDKLRLDIVAPEKNNR
jgi:hypothetical protein